MTSVIVTMRRISVCLGCFGNWAQITILSGLNFFVRTIYSGGKVLAYSMKTYFGIPQERHLAPCAGDLILREGVGTKNTMRQYNN